MFYIYIAFRLSVHEVHHANVVIHYYNITYVLN